MLASAGTPGSAAASSLGRTEPVRETLTALAILLIVALTAALAGPYFVDWNANRGFLEAKLSRALGQKVTIGGAIDLKLLPTPYLVLNQAVIGGDDGPVRLGIRHLDLELSVAPLLHGAFEIVEAQLAEPTIRITLQRDRTLPPLPAAPAFDADVRFDRISLSDGTLAIADPDSGRTLSLEHVDLQAEAESLAGPFHASGALGEGEARTKFRLVTAAPQKGRVHAKLVVDETPTHASLDLDGTMMLAGAADGPLSPAFEGAAIVAGHLEGQGLAAMPWRLAAALRGTLRDAQWSAGELSFGGDAGKLTLAASGDARFGDAPALHLALAGKQLDLDRLSARRAADGSAAPPLLADLLDLGRSLHPSFPTSVDVSVASATFSDAALESVEGAFVLGAAGASPLRLSLDAPGGAHLTIDGKAAAEPNPSFSGHVALNAPDLPALRGWLGRVAPNLALPSVPVQAADIRADVVADADALDLSGLALRLDRSAITGTAHVTSASGARPALVRADLQAAPLDIQSVPDLRALRLTSAATDLDLHLEARGVKVVRFGDGPLEAGHFRLALTRRAGRFALDALRIEGLGGATIDASAAIDATGGHVDATLAAGGLVDIAALARRVAPGAWTDAFAARAASLAPARLTLTATLPPLDAAEGLAPHRLSLRGTLGATRLDVAVAPDPADATRVVASASAAAPEAGALLRQAGLPTLPIAALGAGQIAVEAKGPADGPFDASGQAMIGAARLDLAGRLSPGAAAASGIGRLVSPDVSPLLQALLIAFPDLTGHLPADVKAGIAWTPAGLVLKDLAGEIGGDRLAGALSLQAGTKSGPSLTGALSLDHLSIPVLASLVLGPLQAPGGGAAWSQASFGAGLIDPPASDLDLTIRELSFGRGLIGSDGAMALHLSAGALSLRGVRAKLAGGTLGGDLTVRRDGVNAVLEGQVDASGARIALPGLAGALSGHLALTGIGRTPLALASGLSGTGEARLDDLQIPRADPAALPKVFDDVEADRVSVDEESMLRALDDAGNAPLLAGTRAFTVSLAAGVLHAEPKPAESKTDGRVATSVSLAADIGHATLDARVTETLGALPKDWTGAPPAVVLQFAGPVAAPTRTVDASALVNGLAGRALARETARIEAFEADARERTFFNQRLQADRRREQDRIKAEDDARAAVEAARKAEAERRAREAAARLDRARRAEEAARAVERQAQDRAVQERSAQDRAAQDRALQDRAARDRAATQRQAPEPPPDAGSLEPRATPDPSAAGRY